MSTYTYQLAAMLMGDDLKDTSARSKPWCSAIPNAYRAQIILTTTHWLPCYAAPIKANPGVGTPTTGLPVAPVPRFSMWATFRFRNTLTTGSWPGFVYFDMVTWDTIDLNPGPQRKNILLHSTHFSVQYENKMLHKRIVVTPVNRSLLIPHTMCITRVRCP